MKLLVGIAVLVTIIICFRPTPPKLPNVRRHAAMTAYLDQHEHPLMAARRSLQYHAQGGGGGGGPLQDFVSVARMSLRPQAHFQQSIYEARTLVGQDQSPRGPWSRSGRTLARLRTSLARHASGKPIKFMLVSGERSFVCKSAAGSHALMQSYKNKVDYCSLHGCKVWYMLETWEEGYYGVWARYPALLRLMQAFPSIEWFMWMDADAVFTDLNFTIPFDRYNSWSKNFVAYGFASMLYAEEGNWLSLNAGIFLIRNCKWSYDFLRLWQTLGQREMRQEAREAFNQDLKNRPPEWRADDQSALAYLLRKTQNETQERVYLEAGYFLHGYYEMMVHRYENMARRGRQPAGHAGQWPFTTHFCGCDFCGGRPVLEKCRSGFARAYHFADNQFLSATLSGLHHPNLNVSLVKPLPSRTKNKNKNRRVSINLKNQHTLTNF